MGLVGSKIKNAVGRYRGPETNPAVTEAVEMDIQDTRRTSPRRKARPATTDDDVDVPMAEASTSRSLRPAVSSQLSSRFRPVSSTPLHSQNPISLGTTQSPIRGTSTSKLNITERSPRPTATHSSALISTRSTKLKRISETSPLNPNPPKKSKSPAETLSSSRHFFKQLRSNRLNSSQSSTPDRSPKKRGVTESPPKSRQSQRTTRASTESPRSKTPPKVATQSRQRIENLQLVIEEEEGNVSMSSHSPTSPLQRPKASSANPNNEESPLHTEESICSSVPVSKAQRVRRQIFVDLDEQQESGMSESRNPPPLWLLFSVFSTGLGEKLNKADGSNTFRRKEITELFVNYVNSVYTVPHEIGSDDLEFFAGRVIGGSDPSKGEETYLLLKSVTDEHNRKDVWKVALAGKIAPCLRFSATIGNTLLIYGCQIETTNKQIMIDSDKGSRNLYLFNYCNNGKDRPDYEPRCIVSTSIYSSRDTLSYYLPFDIVQRFSVVVTYPNPPPAVPTTTVSVVNTDVNPIRAQSSSRNGNELSAQPEVPGPSNVRAILRGRGERERSSNQVLSQDNLNHSENSTSDDDESPLRNRNGPQQKARVPGSKTSRMSSRRRGGRERSNDVVSQENVNREETQADIPANVTFTREPEYHSDIEEEPVPLNRPIEDMSYDDWILSGRFVPGDQRPKVRKARPDEMYNYQKLKELDDELHEEIMAEARTGDHPTMMLKTQRFTYGIVDEIIPMRQRTYRSFGVRISDESMEKVTLRICTSKMVPQKGPEIEVGQVIRVHRMTVQVERDQEVEKRGMVLSTTPHRNYTIFDFKENSRNITYNSLAKNIKLTAVDEQIVYNLLRFRDQRARQDVDRENTTNDAEVPVSERVVTIPSDEEMPVNEGEGSSQEFFTASDEERFPFSQEDIAASQVEVPSTSKENKEVARRSRSSPRFFGTPPSSPI